MVMVFVSNKRDSRFNLLVVGIEPCRDKVLGKEFHEEHAKQR
jgi:hypothetical protein